MSELSSYDMLLDSELSCDDMLLESVAFISAAVIYP
jgi:hypothetical protein